MLNEQEKLNLEKKLDRIHRDITLLGEVYIEPVIQGVSDLQIPGFIGDMLTSRLEYLKEKIDDKDLDEFREDLYNYFKQIDRNVGFTSGAYSSVEGFSKPIEITNKFPILKDKIYFLWNLPINCLIDLNSEAISSFRECNGRDLGPIIDPRKKVREHSLSLRTIKRAEGGDTRLTVNFKDKYEKNMHISYNLDYGNLDSVLFQSKEFKEARIIKLEDSIEIMKGLSGIESENIRYYIENSNLSQLHKASLRGLTSKLRDYKKIDSRKLFPGYGVQVNFRSKLGNMFRPKY